ncbi:hypothetical protein HY643_02105 [Candidatus Woesearchaeota archaeon]|nr:hypothetical protein [Candidatus Woesearchaeota archaeon]
MELEIKEKLAQSLLGELLREAGYDLQKVDYEGKFESVLKNKKKIEYQSYLKDLKKYSNEFLIIGKSPLAVQIKVVAKITKEIELPNSDGNLAVIFVTPTPPYFHITWANEFLQTGETQTLEKNSILKIKKSLVKKYSKKVENLLK